MDDAARPTAPRKGPVVPVVPVLLGVLVVALLLVAAYGGWLAVRARADRVAEAEAQQRYAEVTAVARAHAQRLVDLRHDDPAGLEALAAGASDALRARYAADDSPLVRAVRRQRSVSEGEVVATGVVRVDPSTATVLVATDGTVRSRATGGDAVARDLGLELGLVRQDGRWLVDTVEVVR